MPDAAPRLPQQLPDNQPAYAPIAPAAVIAASAAGTFVVTFVGLALAAYFGGSSLLEPWLLVFPALAIVAAFVARRQIQAAEGTRTGEATANLAWYVAVAGGCLFVAYLFGVQYTVRRDAAREFQAFAAAAEKADFDDPRDASLAAAAYHTVTPGQRGSRTEADAAWMQSDQRDVIKLLQASDLGRLLARNRGAAKVSVGSIQEWRSTPAADECVLTGAVETPEGKFPLGVPLVGALDPSKQRKWHVSRDAGAYLSRTARPERTEYGWRVDALSESAAAVSRELFSTLQQPGASALAYDAHVRPGSSREAAAERFSGAVRTAGPRAGLVGAWATPDPRLAFLPEPPDAFADLNGRVFTLPDGSRPGAADLARFRSLWTLPGRIGPSGGKEKGNPDTTPSVTFPAGNVEVSVPAEFVLNFEGQTPPTARGSVVFRLPPTEGAALRAELDRLRDAGPTAPRTTAPPAEVYDQSRRLPWRVERIVSDLRRVEAPRPTPRGGPSGPE